MKVRTLIVNEDGRITLADGQPGKTGTLFDLDGAIQKGASLMTNSIDLPGGSKLLTLDCPDDESDEPAVPSLEQSARKPADTMELLRDGLVTTQFVGDLLAKLENYYVVTAAEKLSRQVDELLKTIRNKFTK